MDNIIIYNTDDGAASVKLYANDGTVWLARAEIAALFQKDRSTISKHIKNIFAEGELVIAPTGHTTRATHAPRRTSAWS